MSEIRGHAMRGVADEYDAITSPLIKYNFLQIIVNQFRLRMDRTQNSRSVTAKVSKESHYILE